MQRKYIYILVILITIILNVSDYYYQENLKKEGNPDQIANEFNNYNEAAILYPLTIVNIQNDNNAQVYTYKLKIDEVRGAYRYTKNGEENYMLFAANGEASITLKSNESVTIYDLPDGANYVITQQLNNKYKTYINSIEMNVIEGVVTAENNITFNNIAIEFTPTNPQEKPNESEEENKTPEENKPNETEQEENKKPSKNPYTNDFVIAYLIILIVSLASLVIYTKIKIKKFE